MAETTHCTAVVIIPPMELWEPIQQIRGKHDRHVRRWMPHVTLVYPFCRRSVFDEVCEPLAQCCQGVAPFQVKLARFEHFHHRRQGYTLWLAPHPPQPVKELQAALRPAVADCDDLDRYTGGFTPHLSVGQVRGRENLARLQEELQNDWSPLIWPVEEIALIWRPEKGPDDVFRLDSTIPLGRGQSSPIDSG